MSSQLSLRDEAYLCLLCLKNSTERIARLYWTYIQLRSITKDAPPVLMAMLGVLCSKQEGLQQKLKRSWPEYMQEKKWHDLDEQTARLNDLSSETKEELQQICSTEIKMLQLVYIMLNQN